MPLNLVSIVGLLILIGLSSFSAAAETALTSVSHVRVKHMVEENIRGAELLSKLLQHPSRFLATILILNNLVNIGAASLATMMVVQYFRYLNIALSTGYIAGLSTGIVTFLVLIYGEITPKTYAAQNPEKFALLIAGPVSLLVRIFFPIARLFIFIANLFTRLLGGKTTREGPFLTEEEIKTMVTVGEEEGVIEEEEKEMIHSIFEFGDTIVKEVMVPRMDMVCVEDDATAKDVLIITTKEGFSRIPVFEESVDNIVGIVYAKDLLKLNKSRETLHVSVKKLMHPAYYIPETKKVNELLRELQKKRQHMAIVLDEYGGTAGLVTIEDLLEEIVGEIFDEYDLEEILIEKVDELNYRVDARADLDKINEFLEIDLPEDYEFETIGGFVYNLTGRVPAAGEKVAYGELVFTVEKLLGRRISKILISIKAPEDEVHKEIEEA